MPYCIGVAHSLMVYGVVPFDANKNVFISVHFEFTSYFSSFTKNELLDAMPREMRLTSAACSRTVLLAN